GHVAPDIDRQWAGREMHGEAVTGAETPLARREGGHARPGSAGLGGDTRALPYRQPDRPVVHQLSHADIDPLRKQRVVVDRSGVAGKVDPRKTVDEEDGVRIADPEADAVIERAVADGQV